MRNYNLSLMVSKLRILAFLMCLSTTQLFSQEIPSSSDPEINSVEMQEFNDTWTSPEINDEMTIDAEQNKSWRMGDYKYSSRPKHSWEFGLHFGQFFIDGDIDAVIPGGWGVGLHLRKSLNYVLSLRGSVFYGMARGLEKQPWNHRNYLNGGGIGGGLVENVFEAYNPNSGGPGQWFPAYETRFVAGDLSAILNIGNILFHKERNKWNVYLGLGFGFDNYSTKLDLLDDANRPYSNLVQNIQWTSDLFNTKQGRSQIVGALENIYDGTYETEGFKQKGALRIGDDFNFHFVIIPTFGVSRKLSKRINISLEHQLFISDNDYLDGIKFRSSVDQTRNDDMGHYTNVRIGLNIGNFKKVTEPLYWLNPMDQAFSDIAIAKSQSQLDLADEDNDGVIDLIDQELNTPEDCPVDTRGILLDSDGDGIADCEDREPYSRPGCEIDQYGIAQCDDDMTNEGAVAKLIDDKLEAFRYDNSASGGNTNYSKPGYIGTSNRTLSDEKGNSYVLTIPTDANGKFIATERAIKTGVNTDGSHYSMLVPVDKMGNILANEGMTNENFGARNMVGTITRSGKSSDGSAYELTIPVDEDGDIIATKRALKKVTKSDGSQYDIYQAVDSDGNFVSSEEASKVIENADGSTYELSVPVDSAGEIIATNSARKTVVNPDGSAYILSLPIDDQGNFIPTNKATKAVINPDGSHYIVTLPTDGNGNFVASDRAVKTVVNSDGSAYMVTLPVDGNGNFVATQKAEKTVINPDGTGYVLTLPTDKNGNFVASGKATKSVTKADGSKSEYIVAVDSQGNIIESSNAGANSESGILPSNIRDGLKAYTTLGNNPSSTSAPSVASGNFITSGCGDWFLPMIHFDLNKSKIKPEYYSHLHNVAQVMNKCPEVCVVALGYTDTRSSNDYNRVLSYFRAKAAVDYLVDAYEIDRNRLKLMYGGEDNPMVLSPSSEAHHFMNRRVEFRTCEAGDKDMDAPAGSDKKLQGSSAKPEFYNGNKSSGY